MKFQMFFKVLIPIFISFIISACSVSTVNKDGSILDILNIKKEKIIEYKREAVSENLINTVSQIIEAMNANNLTLINQKFIHPTFGFYDLYRTDGMNTFTYQQNIYSIPEEDIEEICHVIKRMRKVEEPLSIKLEESNFDCSPNNDEFYGWNKSGVFLNANTETFLTNIMTKSNELEKDKYKKEDFQKAMEIEKTSYKVIVTPDMVFYVTKIDNAWYLSLFDRISTDCSLKEEKNESTRILE